MLCPAFNKKWGGGKPLPIKKKEVHIYPNNKRAIASARTSYNLPPKLLQITEYATYKSGKTFRFFHRRSLR